MKKKNYNMELIRTISFIMVIVIHITNYFCRAYTDIGRGEYFFALFWDTVSRVSVPCFFMLSGALLLGKTERLRKNGERLLRFLIILICWSMVYYFFNIYYMETPCNLKNIFYEPTEPHLWYLYATIPIYFVLPFFQIMCRGMNANMDKAFLLMCSLVTVFMYCSSLGQAEPYYDVPIIGDKAYSFYFFLGYFIYKYREKLKGKGTRFLLVFVCSTALNIGLTAWITVRKGEHYERFLEYGCPLVIMSGVAFFAWILQLNQGEIRLGTKAKKWMDLWCSCSFGIYLIHILFLDNYKKYLAPDEVSAFVAIPVLAVGILILSFGCVYVIRKLPFVRYIS